MKSFISLFIALLVIAVSCKKSSVEPEVAELKYSFPKLSFKLDNQLFEEDIPVQELSGNDTIFLNAYNENLRFSFTTDLDSIEGGIPLHNSFHLNLINENHLPLVITVTNGLKLEPLKFETSDNCDNIQFRYNEDIHSPYLQELRMKYPIDSLAALGNTELDKVRIIASWVHGLWEHDGWNTPEKWDALYILEEVKKGQRFRCVEYGIVTTACLNAIGLKSRTLSLKTKDAESRPSGAGHVVMEVYLNELNKWVMIDTQYDVIAVLNKTPLNAVEIQQAITEGKKIELLSSEEESKVKYIPWIYQYLYYFSIPFDNRENIDSADKLRMDDKTDFMLVPVGAKEPTIFQRHYAIDNCLYTNSLECFYRKP